MKFKIIKSELVEKKETHVYTLEKQQVNITLINNKPVHAIVRPGNLDKEGAFIMDGRQEALGVDLEDPRMIALVKVLKEVYEEI